MYEQLCIFFTALTFFTRIPHPKWITYSEDRLNRSAMYFPLIGWIVGAITALVFWLGFLIFPMSVALLLSMVVSLFLTGAFHEDGWADVCDGFGGGWNKQEILRIMKDSRIGVYGTIGLIVLLGLKFVALYEMKMQLVPWALISGHSMSRFVSTTFLHTHSYVQDNEVSKAKPLATRISWQGLAVAAFFGIMPVLLLGDVIYFLVIIPLVICKWGMGKYFVKWIGGYTGDCLGAAQQVSEVIFYLFIILVS